MEKEENLQENSENSDKQENSENSDKQEKSKNNENETESNLETTDSNKEENKELSAEDKIKELEDKLIRTFAEMENQRRRFEKEKEDAFEFGGFLFAKESLALIDNLERAKISFIKNKKLKENNNFQNILETFEILEKDLIGIFKRNHIEQIVCLNKKFDPNFHQAMLEIDDSSKEPGTVVQEIQKGYTMKSRLLRPSLVGVTRFKTENAKKDQENKENNENKK